MRLIFIYGPPAVGKLTVATELGRLTSFAVFDNHRSIDCVLPVFAFGTEPFGRLVETIRLAVIEEAAVRGVDTIFTFAYAHPEDTDYVERLCAVVEKQGGAVCFVQLVCDKEVQVGRALHAGRAASQKLRSEATVRALNERYDLFTPISGRESLSIDNTMLAPAEVATRIVEHYGLPAGDQTPP